MLQLSKESKGLIRDHVHETLRKNIIQLKLEPGRLISEKDVMEMLQVSRTPIREALVKLAQEGLIETIPQKGSYISLIDLDYVDEARFVREQLETSIVRLACTELNSEQILHLQNFVSLQELCVTEKNYGRLFELDEEFHKLIFIGCNKARTWAMLQQMSTHLHRIRFLRLAVNYDWDCILSQHNRIVQAIRAGDADAAEQTMREHLTQLKIEKVELLEKFPNYFKLKPAYRSDETKG